MYVVEEINEGNRARSGCSEPPFGSSSGGDDGQHDHSQQYEPTERTYHVQNGTQIDHPFGNKHDQPIESNAGDADPPRNADSTVLRRVHCRSLYQQRARCGSQLTKTGVCAQNPVVGEMGISRQLGPDTTRSDGLLP